MELPNGYEMKSTFIDDFKIAEHFGEDAIKSTLEKERAFIEQMPKEDRTDYYAELYIALNWGIWRTYEERKNIAELYNELWSKFGEEIDKKYEEGELSQEEITRFYHIVD